jgi:hypothetical protein
MTSNQAGIPVSRRTALQRAGAAVSLPLLGAPFLLHSNPASAEPRSGTVSIDQVQIAFLLNAGWGTGTLHFAGVHRFKIKGIGVGGIGVNTLEAYGNVFRLKKLADFPGAYGSVQAGAVAVDAQLRGGMWMQNTSGVQIHLLPVRKGVSLNLGADGVLVTFDT